MIVRWIGIMLFYGFGFVTAPIVYPVLYLFRNKINSWWFDDEDGHYGNEKFKKGRKESFWLAYQWSALRNPFWNGHTKTFIPNSGVKHYISHKGEIKKDGNFDISVYDMAVIKTTDKYGKYEDNFGDYFSYKYSIIGKMYVKYWVGNKDYFRFSYVKKPHWILRVFFELIRHLVYLPINIVLLLINMVRRFILKKDIIPFLDTSINIKGWWVEIMAGTNDFRHLFRFKVKRLKQL